MSLTGHVERRLLLSERVDWAMYDGTEGRAYPSCPYYAAYPTLGYGPMTLVSEAVRRAIREEVESP